ncbi:hypothetical protein CsSME_00043528 [Camellia sinensis var. sinensis]
MRIECCPMMQANRTPVSPSTSDAPMAPSSLFRSPSFPPLDHSSPSLLTTATSRRNTSASFTRAGS